MGCGHSGGPVPADLDTAQGTVGPSTLYIAFAYSYLPLRAFSGGNRSSRGLFPSAERCHWLGHSDRQCGGDLLARILTLV